MKKRIIASIEARMGSCRLPGKMLADLGGISTLALLIRRTMQSAFLDGIVVATTNNPADDALAATATTEGAKVFRGSEDDVLARVVGAQRMMESDVIVELNGDCPLIDPAIIDRGIARYGEGDCDLVTTTAHQTYPPGMDVQVFALNALEWVEANVDDPDVREHVSLYFYEHPERYQIANLDAPDDLSDPKLRLLLDYDQDLQVLRAVHGGLAPVHGDAYGLTDILAWLHANTSVREINRDCVKWAART